MSVLDKYINEEFITWLIEFFGIIPAGFLLGMLSALLGYGIFKLINMIKRV